MILEDVVMKFMMLSYKNNQRMKFLGNKNALPGNTSLEENIDGEFKENSQEGLRRVPFSYVSEFI